MKNVKSRYGITIKDYDKLREIQDYSCAICGTHENEINTRLASGTKRHRLLVIDHCHQSNEVRGLLCHDCNVMLGNAKDDIARLKSAIEYLTNSNQGA